MANFENYRPRRKQDSGLITALCVIIAALAIMVFYEISLLATKDKPRLISHTESNGLNTLIFSYRDTVKMDSLSAEQYQRVIQDIHLGKGND